MLKFKYYYRTFIDTVYRKVFVLEYYEEWEYSNLTNNEISINLN